MARCADIFNNFVVVVFPLWYVDGQEDQKPRVDRNLGVKTPPVVLSGGRGAALRALCSRLSSQSQSPGRISSTPLGHSSPSSESPLHRQLATQSTPTNIPPPPLWQHQADNQTNAVSNDLDISRSQTSPGMLPGASSNSPVKNRTTNRLPEFAQVSLKSKSPIVVKEETSSNVSVEEKIKPSPALPATVKLVDFNDKKLKS